MTKVMNLKNKPISLSEEDILFYIDELQEHGRDKFKISLLSVQFNEVEAESIIEQVEKKQESIAHKKNIDGCAEIIGNWDKKEA